MVRIFILLSMLFLFLQFKKKTVLKPFYISGYAQGTTYHVTYYAAYNLIKKKEIDSILNALDRSISIYNSSSLISRFNNAEKGVLLDKHLKIVVKKSLEIYKSSRGRFDITVYPLLNAWGFGPEKNITYPDAAAISKIMPCVGSDKLMILRKHLLKKLPCVKIDVNGIGQGYSVDVIADYLGNKKIKTYVVDIGGEIRVNGKKPNNELLKVGIETPAGNTFTDTLIKIIIQMQKGAVTTSGNYRKYIEKGNDKISHLIDPKTGYPFKNELISVTIIAKDAITADGYDNALMGMGLEKALSFIQPYKDIHAYFIYQKPDGMVGDTATAGFYKFLKN